MASCMEPGSVGGFCLLKGSFFLSAVATCMIGFSGCCEVNNRSDFLLLLDAGPGEVNAESQWLDAICWISIDRNVLHYFEQLIDLIVLFDK